MSDVSKNGNSAPVISGLMPQIYREQKIESWHEFRDRLAPQGRAVEARLLVDRTFTVLRMRPYESKFPGSRTEVYWCVVLTDDGELFNTTLGGSAVCDVLDKIQEVRNAYTEAEVNGDVDRVRDLEQLGALALFSFTMRWMDQGAGRGYYYFE